MFYYLLFQPVYKVAWNDKSKWNFVVLEAVLNNERASNSAISPKLA